MNIGNDDKSTQSEKIKLNLDNPIFVFYINVEGYSTERANEILKVCQKNYNIYENATVWIVASDVTKIECIYDGCVKNRKVELTELIKQINSRIEVISQSHNFEDFKINIRDWRIESLINGNKEEL
jgi:hypothetical protein